MKPCSLFVFAARYAAIATPMHDFRRLLRRAGWIAAVSLLSMRPAAADKLESLTLVLIDAPSRRPIVKHQVTLWGDMEVRCIRAPCPMLVGILWKGTTNSRGVVIVGRKVVKPDTVIQVPGYASQHFRANAAGTERRILMARASSQL